MPDQNTFFTVVSAMYDLLNRILKWGQVGQKSCLAFLASDLEEIVVTLSVKFTIPMPLSRESRPLFFNLPAICLGISGNY